jgi:hypothetical protein
MSYSAVRGLGDGTTDPPPSAYCGPCLQELASYKNAAQSCSAGAAALQAQFDDANRQWDKRLSSCQSSAGAAAAGAGQAIAARDAQITKLQSDLDAARAKVCPKPKSCLIWMIIAAVGTGVAIVQTARGSKDKKDKGKQTEKLPGRTSSKKEG